MKSNINNYKSSEEYQFLRYIIALRRRMKKKQGRAKIKKFWKVIGIKLLGILLYLELNINIYLLGPFFRQILIPTYKEELEALYSTILQKLIDRRNYIKQEKIKLHIEQRNANLQDSQKKMIDSVMEREIRKIVIDHVLTFDDNNEEKLLTRPYDIKKEVNNHFQNVAGTISVNKEIPPEWIEDYKPLENVDQQIYNPLNDPISLDELEKNINELPSKTANGPNNISYEDLKLLTLEIKQYLVDLYNTILKTKEIPQEWLNANVYPIPKPKPWGYLLTNTRPITLLDTTRKLFTKIITKRISSILANNQVLSGYNFAALPKNSTFEPVRILNEIINQAQEEDDELWMLSLDMSKAYDHVNLYMLKKALLRIKLPHNIVEIIINLFTNRKNQVFTDVGLTDPYELLTGIDQGESISPLLWIIYYDPLLNKWKNSGLGYNVKSTEILDVYNNVLEDKSINFAGSAFMDDTNALAPNQQNVEKLLSIADSFYTLNDIQINKKKTDLLLRLPKNKLKE
jgi:hypothetical protein